MKENKESVRQQTFKIKNPDNSEAFRIMTAQGRNPGRIVESTVKEVETGKTISTTSINPYSLINKGDIGTIITFLDNLQRQTAAEETVIKISST